MNYESLKRALKTKTIYGYRYDERLKTNVEESTRLACTPLCAELDVYYESTKREQTNEPSGSGPSPFFYPKKKEQNPLEDPTPNKE